MQCLAYQTKFRLGSSFIRLGNAHKVQVSEILTNKILHLKIEF